MKRIQYPSLFAGSSTLLLKKDAGKKNAQWPLDVTKEVKNWRRETRNILREGALIAKYDARKIRRLEENRKDFRTRNGSVEDISRDGGQKKCKKQTYWENYDLDSSDIGETKAMEQSLRQYENGIYASYEWDERDEQERWRRDVTERRILKLKNPEIVTNGGTKHENSARGKSTLLNIAF